MERRELAISVEIPDITYATNQVAFIVPFDCQLVRTELRFRVTSTSGTLDVENVPDGTAVGSGTSLLTGTMSLSGTADERVRGAIATGVHADRLLQGQAIGLVFAGTLTGLLDLNVTLILRQLSYLKD